MPGRAGVPGTDQTRRTGRAIRIRRNNPGRIQIESRCPAHIIRVPGRAGVPDTDLNQAYRPRNPYQKELTEQDTDEKPGHGI